MYTGIFIIFAKEMSKEAEGQIPLLQTIPPRHIKG